MKLASIFFTASAGNLRVCLNIFIATTYKTADVMLKMRKRLTKKALLSLRLPPKSSFTSSKLRFWSLCKPKNSSFYTTSQIENDPIFTFGSFSICYLCKTIILYYYIVSPIRRRVPALMGIQGLRRRRRERCLSMVRCWLQW